MISGISKFLTSTHGHLVHWLSCAVVIAALSSAAFAEKAGEVQIQKCWSHSSGPDRSGIAAAGETIFSTRNGSIIEAIAVDSGKLIWSNDVGGSVASNLVTDGPNLYFVRRTGFAGDNTTQAFLVSISANAGITRWKTPLLAGEEYKLALTRTGILAINDSGELSSFSIVDGVSRSSRKSSRPVTLGILKLGERSIISTFERDIISLVGNEEPRVMSRSDFAVTALLPEADGGVFYGNDRGILALLSGKDTRPVWQFKSGGAISDIIVTDGRIIAASNDNFVYALATSNGARRWKRRVKGRVSALKMVGKDLLLVQPLGDDNIIFLSTRNGSVSGQIPATAGEFVLDSTVIDSNRLVVATDTALYGYSIGGCRPAK